MFVELVRGLRDPVRARRQEKIREVELTWSDHDLSNFRIFAVGLQPAEMADVCYALADATAIPLLELLVDYAGVNFELLQIAFQSLDKAPLSARLFLSERLLASENPMIRASACDMLGRVGPAAAERLVTALDDGNSYVEAASIRALVKIGHAEAGEKIVARLKGDSEEIRSLALDAMLKLGAHSAAFEMEALSLLRGPDTKIELRRKAARALAKMGSSNGRLAMLEILSDQKLGEDMRRVAAESLCGYADAEAAAALLKAAKGDSAGLAGAARQAILGMPPTLTLEILRQHLRGGDIGLAMVAAEILGGMSGPEAGMILGDCLQRETRPALVAAIADALGKSGYSGAWKALYRKLRGNSADSLPVLAALADAATEDNLDDFALLLDDLPESGAGELVLRRLAAFCRTLAPSLAVQRRAVDILDSGNRALAIQAVEILAYSGNDALRERLLTEMTGMGAELPTRRLLRVMLKSKNGELAGLFAGVEPEVSPLIVDATAEAESVGHGGVEFFGTLAGWVRSEAKGAREGLAAAARLDPVQLLAAMSESSDRVFLLEAWMGLDPRDRLRHFPDLDDLFAACGPADRLQALRILANLGEERHLRTVAMLAFTDRDTNVRAAAISLVRSLVELK